MTREPGPTKGGKTVIAFVEDPTGYKFELIQRQTEIPEPLAQAGRQGRGAGACGCAFVCWAGMFWAGWPAGWLARTRAAAAAATWGRRMLRCGLLGARQRACVASHA